MTCTECREFLEAGIGDDLDPADRRALEEHLENCGRCRLKAEELAALNRAVGELPREIAPARDLWPGIRTRLEQVDATEREFRIWRFPRLTHPLAAAAALLAVLIGALTLLSTPGGRYAGLERFSGDRTIGLITTAAMERQYLGAAEELLYAMAEARSTLPETTLAVIDENLDLVDQAISDSRTAVQKYPSDVELQSMLAAAWEQKLALLQQTARMTGLY
jgi:hypothetical protein